MITARLNVRTESMKLSRSVIKASKPDNSGSQGLRIIGLAGYDSARFLVKYDGKIETFISTLDDMLSRIQAATKTLRDNKIEHGVT